MEVDWILKSLYQRFYVQFRLPAMCIGELSAVITQLMSKCLWSGWKCSKGYKEIASTFTCSPVNPEYLWKKRQIKKPKKTNYSLQHVRTDSRCMWMKSILNLSRWRSLFYRNQSNDLQNKPMGWFLYNKNLRHERVNALLLACIHSDIFLGYDKIIAPKYQRRMLFN